MELHQNPQVEEILLRFQNLRSSQDRRAVYVKLLEELHIHEMRELKDRIEKKDFYRDILGTLPLEISAQIAAYLDIADLFRLQGVCKRWKFLLSSRLVRDAVVTFHYGRGQRGIVKTDSTWAFTEFAKRRVMLERGRPISQGHFSWQLQLYEISMDPMDYSNGRYAWVEMETFVFVRHLQTGALQRFCTENRDIFDFVRITDCIVAAFTRRGACHVWSLDNTASGVFRLPSAGFDRFVANGTKVVFSFRGSLLHWDLKTKASHSIPIPIGLHLIVLHPTADRVSTVHIAHADSGRYMGSIPTDRARFTLLHFVRVNDNNGSVVGNSSMFLEQKREIIHIPSSIGPGGAFYEDLTDRKTRCNHRLGSVHINWHNNRDLTEALILTADPVTARVFMHRTMPGSIHNVGLSMAVTAPDLLYYIRKVEGEPSLCISNALAVKREHRASKAMTRDLQERGLSWEGFDRRLMLLGDDHSVLLVDSAGMRVWSFDRGAVAFGAVPVVY